VRGVLAVMLVLCGVAALFEPSPWKLVSLAFFALAQVVAPR